jgi:hypothetical protein
MITSLSGFIGRRKTILMLENYGEDCCLIAMLKKRKTSFQIFTLKKFSVLYQLRHAEKSLLKTLPSLLFCL